MKIAVDRRVLQNSLLISLLAGNLVSPDGTAIYVNRYQEPAFFSAIEANDDIQRYSRKICCPRAATVSVGPARRAVSQYIRAAEFGEPPASGSAHRLNHWASLVAS